MIQFTHKIKYKLLSKALGISEDLAKKFINDGRIIGRLGEFILEEHGIGNRSDSENTPYDNVSDDGKRIEVRSITEKVSFASSKEIGFGRKVTEDGFKTKLESLDFYVCINYDENGIMEFIPITKEDISNMQSIGIVRKNKSVSKKKFINYVKNK